MTASKLSFGIIALAGSAAEAIALIHKLDGAGATVAAITAPAPQAPAAAPVAQAPAAAPIDASSFGVDADGMGWNEELHQHPPVKTEKGLWKVRKGKADADKAARAAFKASGAGVVNPTIPTVPAAPTVPTVPVASTMPTMPTMPAAPAPVFVPTYEQASSKLIGMVNGGVISMDTVAAIYAACGVTNPDEFASDDNKRLVLWNELCKYQPVG